MTAAPFPYWTGRACSIHTALDVRLLQFLVLPGAPGNAPGNGNEDGQDLEVVGASSALQVMHIAMSGESLPRGMSMADSDALLRAEFDIRPFQEDGLSYAVRYELELGTREDGAGIFPHAERITYVEQRSGRRERRRKAFETIGVSVYKGLHPLDICMALAPHGNGLANLSALRILCEAAGRSFLFSTEFKDLAQRTIRMRPGAFFLRSLQAYARRELGR